MGLPPVGMRACREMRPRPSDMAALIAILQPCFSVACGQLNTRLIKPRRAGDNAVGEVIRRARVGRAVLLVAIKPPLEVATITTVEMAAIPCL